ncbi:MAG: hypothetical protein RL220_1801 [Bacteroidota bacterium]
MNMDHVLLGIMELHCDLKDMGRPESSGWLSLQDVTSVFGDDEPGPFISHCAEFGECTLVFHSSAATRYKLVECNSNGTVCSDRMVDGNGTLMSVPLCASDVVNQVSLYSPAGELLFSGKYRAV